MAVARALLRQGTVDPRARPAYSKCKDAKSHKCVATVIRACARFHFASRFASSSFETLNIRRTALSIFSASVLPGTAVLVLVS